MIWEIGTTAMLVVIYVAGAVIFSQWFAGRLDAYPYLKKKPRQMDKI